MTSRDFGCGWQDEHSKSDPFLAVFAAVGETHGGLVEADLDDPFPEDLFAEHAHLSFDE